MDIFDLVAKLSLDSSAYEDGLKNAESDAQSAGGKLGSVLGKIGGGASVAIGAVVTGVTAISGAVVNGTTDLAEYADNIDKMSQKMGISAEAYQEWDAVMQHSGTSMETLKASMKTMANAVENNNEAFAKLGITEEQLATMSQEDIFSSVITGLQNMEEGTERTYIAGQLLGRGATELGALLNTSAEETQAMKDRVHELGGVLSDEAVKAGASFQDQLQDMQTASQSLSRNLLSDFLPSITTVMGGLTDIFAGDYATGLNKISNGIDETVTTVTEKLPQFMEIGASIVMSLGKAIVTNAPKILKAGIDVMKELAVGLTDALPDLLDTASEIITTVIDSLTETLPELLPKILSAVIQLVERLLDHLPEILTSLLNLVKSLVDSLLKDGLPMLISALPDIILGVVNFILNAIPQIITAVIDIVLAIVREFPTIMKTLVSALPQIITGVIVAILSAIPQLVEAGIQLFISLISALPQITIEIVKAVPEIIKGIVQGFKDNAPQIKESGKQLLKSLASGLGNVGTTIGDAVKNIWNALKSKFTEMSYNATKWGVDLILNFVNGIKSKIQAVVDTVKNVAGKVKDFLGFSEPKDGPLSNFHTFAPDMMKLFTQGIYDNINLIDNAVESVGEAITDGLANPDYSGEIVGMTNASAYGTMNTGSADMAQVIDLLTQLVNKDGVVLSPDADGIFEIVKQREKVFRKSTGYAY